MIYPVQMAHPGNSSIFSTIVKYVLERLLVFFDPSHAIYTYLQKDCAKIKLNRWVENYVATLVWNHLIPNAIYRSLYNRHNGIGSKPCSGTKQAQAAMEFHWKCCYVVSDELCYFQNIRHNCGTALGLYMTRKLSIKSRDSPRVVPQNSHLPITKKHCWILSFNHKVHNLFWW